MGPGCEGLTGGGAKCLGLLCKAHDWQVMMEREGLSDGYGALRNTALMRLLSFCSFRATCFSMFKVKAVPPKHYFFGAFGYKQSFRFFRLPGKKAASGLQGSKSFGFRVPGFGQQVSEPFGFTVSGLRVYNDAMHVHPQQTWGMPTWLRTSPAPYNPCEAA